MGLPVDQRRIAPHMPSGGAFVLDDFDDYGGCRRAATAFLGQTADVERESVANSAVIVRRYGI